ncbi:PASTA domain-containing protein [candidate division GN15 bacterium]|nr:PASTA domain-containing protein [candidate division GN15 bacterium]
MSRLRASRLSQTTRQKSGFIDKYLPLGSLQRKIVFRAVIPILAVIILILIVDRIVMPIVTRQGAAFPLPDYSGQTVTEAQVNLNDLDLGYEVSSERFSPGQEAGVILDQFPKPGTKVKPDRTIKFVVSLGEKQVAIPELAGKSVRQAMLDLETVGLKLGEIAWAFSDTIPERVVVFSYPSGGTEIPLGSFVNLMVNRGRASSFTYMPKVVGLTLDEARKRLEDKSLLVGIVSYRADENFLPETVLEQSEPEGTELDVNTEIDLVVSSTE